ncbi:MAG: hypothetical protein LRY68_11630 [Sulfurospirillum sp.]|nr:hypothetical protein [Sulfurospirillum sp.]
MRHLNEQLFIAFECISAIGTSLDLKIMVEHFQKVICTKDRCFSFNLLAL